ncbi:MAG: molybdopterin-dependent oxidoreductase [Nocardioides sp.]|nr:molybdopterin-dependent oxidoreductase [Nocardioides sp.]
MSTDRLPWVPAGVLAGLAGLATSHAAAMVLTLRDAPFVAVAGLIVRLVPEVLADRLERIFGQGDRMALFVVEFLVLLAFFAVAGQLARDSRWKAAAVWAFLAAVGLVAVLVQFGHSPNDVAPVAAGLMTWLAVHAALLNPLRVAAGEPPLVDHERRVFLMVALMTTAASAGIALAGRAVGNARRHVDTSRRLLRIDGVTRRPPPPAATLGLPGITPWQTTAEEFFVADTTIAAPTIEPQDWRLRIHGMVERELILTFDALVSRPLTESWITLACVTNEVGGGQVGNARWSGVRLADLLAEAGVQAGADCVRQTSHDGWDCATPLAALADDRDAMLAVAMNGRPLPIEHGFPVRTIVPGLFGHVSAAKWVVDLEVTRFDEVETWWTSRGWSEQAPVRLASRIDTPRPGEQVPAGEVAVGGVAWHPHTGVASVEVSLDGRRWEPAELGRVPSDDTWVQWAITLDVPAGEHLVRVRAVARDGEVQTGVRSEPSPDGATGWHEVEFSAAEA